MHIAVNIRISMCPDFKIMCPSRAPTLVSQGGGALALRKGRRGEFRLTSLLGDLYLGTVYCEMYVVVFPLSGATLLAPSW